MVFKVSSVYQTQVSYYSLPSFFGMARPPKKPPGTTRSELESDHGLADDDEEAEKKPAAHRVSHGKRDPIKEAIDQEFTIDSEEDKEQTNDNKNDKMEEIQSKIADNLKAIKDLDIKLKEEEKELDNLDKDLKKAEKALKTEKEKEAKGKAKGKK